MAETNPSAGLKTKKIRWGIWAVVIALLVLLLAGGMLVANRSIHGSVLTPFWQPTITLTPTNTWTPSPTYTPSVTPTPTITPTPTPPVIGADFTPELVELARMDGIDTLNGTWGNRYNFGNNFNAMAFSPDGILFSFADWQGIHIWNLQDGKSVQQWGLFATALAFSADGTSLIAYAYCDTQNLPCRPEDGKIVSFEVTSGEMEWEFPIGSDNLSFSHNGQYAIYNNGLFVVDLVNKVVLQENSNFYGYVKDASISPDGRLLASVFSDGIVRIWEIGNITAIKTFSQSGYKIGAASFLPDGSLLALYSTDGSIKFYETNNWTLVREIFNLQDTADIQFTSDGKIMIVSFWMGHDIKFIDVGTGEILYTIPLLERAYRMLLSEDGSELAVATSEGVLRVFNLDYEPYDGSDDWTITERLVREFPGGHTASVISVAFSPDGSLLASASADHTVKIWRTEDWVTKYTLIGHENPVEIVAFSPDGALLASGADDKTVRIWDTQSGAEVKVLEGHEEPIFALSFSPDGNLLASGSADRTVKIWQVSDWSLATTLEDHGDWVWSVSFSPDGKLLASASGDSYVRLWQVSDWQMLGKFGEGGAYAGAVAFSPDQTIIGRGGWDGQVRLYDVETTELLRTLTDPEMQKEDWWEHTSRIWSIAFSPDGSLVVAASLDQNVRIWRVSDGELLQVLEMDADVYSVAVSRNGWWMAAASGVDVTIWGLPRWEQIPNANATLQPTPTP